MARTLTKSLKSATLAAAALATAFVPGMMTAAEAKGGHGHHHHHRHGFYRHVGFYAPAYVAYGYGSGCGWLKARAVSTGSRYWWNRYHACIGD